MNFNPDQPYNDLPILPPAADLETKAILKACISANKRLAELKGAGDLIPNQSVLINSIPLQEAQASSEIENIVTTSDELFKAAASEKETEDPTVKEVLRYREALRHGFERLASRPIGTNLMIEICGKLRNQPVDIRKLPGTKIVNPSTQQTIYTPPEGERIIRDKLANLENFLYAEDQLDPLIKMAVMHYQFEAIHPFHDGNGRTGRILNILFLIERKLLSIPVLYLSGYIIKHKEDYYRGLREVTENQSWEQWILYCLHGISTTAEQTCNKIHAIRALMEEIGKITREKLPPAFYSKELVEIIFSQPYCKVNFLIDAGIAGRQTSAKYLNALENIGVLKSEKIGRERIYLNTKLLKLLIGSEAR